MSSLWQFIAANAPAVEPLRQEDPSTCGPFRLLGRIGAGGMGVIYLGEGVEGERVAVKRVRVEHSDQPQFRQRLQREVEAMRSLPGDFTARLVAANVIGSPQWLAMDYVPGPTLQQVVEAGGRLDADQARALAAAVAQALAEIHAAGFTHRDLKPSNIVLSESGPRLIDFGIAGVAESSDLTQGGWMMGSLAWMTPEQLTGHVSTSSATDVHGWATVVFYGATGKNPFGSGPPEAVAFRIQFNEPDLSAWPTELPELGSLVRKGLSKDPRQRPSTAEILEGLGCPSTEQPVGPATLAPRVPPPPVPVPVGAARSGSNLPPPPSPAGGESSPGTDAHRPSRRRPLVMGVALGVGAVLLVALGAGIGKVVMRSQEPAPSAGVAEPQPPSSSAPASSASSPSSTTPAQSAPSALAASATPAAPAAGITVNADKGAAGIPEGNAYWQYGQSERFATMRQGDTLLTARIGGTGGLGCFRGTITGNTVAGRYVYTTAAGRTSGDAPARTIVTEGDTLRMVSDPPTGDQLTYTRSSDTGMSGSLVQCQADLVG